MTFFSLQDLNREIKRLLDPYNDLLLKRRQASRRELFQSVEREYLKPLPAGAYELKDYRRAKVQKMGYVYFSPDKSYYSVPYRYIGKETTWLFRFGLCHRFRSLCASDFGSNCANVLGSFCASGFWTGSGTVRFVPVVTVRFVPPFQPADQPL